MSAEISDSRLTTALIGAASGVLVTFLTAWVAVRHYQREQAHHEEKLLNALFGELANILEHYAYAVNELPLSADDPHTLRMRLQWSRFGNLRSTEEIDKYGFLKAGDIRLLLQLNLRIRNTDLLLDSMVSDLSTATELGLKAIRERMRYAIATSTALLKQLVAAQPVLAEVLSEIKAQLPLPEGSL
jgi:hypothetical protein